VKIFSQWKQMETLGNKMLQKSCTNYVCEICNYNTCRKSSYDKHLLTEKHKKKANGNNIATLETFSCKKLQNNQLYSCDNCQKEFLNRSGLWKHKKKCDLLEQTSNTIISKDEQQTDKQLIMMLIKENSELRKEQTDIKELILEIVKNGTISNTNSYNNNTTNSHNKAFNLNFFLNETCKNAMNITDFVDSIKLQLSDLMDVGELGYVEGISKIIVKNLNNLDETIRPIHCTDKKRETMYIKDEGEWTKEDEKKTKLKKVINKVADKNIRLLPAFREKYPEYKNAYSKISDKYDKLVIEVMETDEEKKEKIIKNISKVTTIAEKLPVGS
jgi:ribosomal protein L37AE/L43A